MSITVFGIRITLNDYQSKVTQDSDFGFYNREYTIVVNASAGQKNVILNNVTGLNEGDKLHISDDTPQSEQGVINTIVGNTVTLFDNLQNTYTTAQNATATADSQIKWLQQSITGVANWNSSMIVKNGLSVVTKSVNVKQGGNIADISGISVSVDNTQQFFKELQDRNVSLQGLRIEYVYFIDGVETRLFDGVCQKPKWTVQTYMISGTYPRNLRNADLSTEINSTDFLISEGSEQIGKIIPLTYGEWKNKFVKFIRSADRQTQYINVNRRELNPSGPDSIQASFSLDTVGIKVFPVVGDDNNTPPIRYNIKLSDSMAWLKNDTPVYTGTHPLSYFETDTYLKVIDGEGNDQNRRIESAIVDLDTDPTSIQLTLSDYFPENLIGNATATETDNSWVIIVKEERKFQGDAWPCKAYLNTDGDEITQALNLYSYIEEKQAKFTTSGGAETIITPILEKPLSYIRLPEYAYEDSGDGNNNIVDIDVKLFKNDPDNMDSVLILPVTNPSLVDEGSLQEWQISEDWSNVKKIEDSLYYRTNATLGNVGFAKVGSENNVIDINKTTSCNLVTSYTLVTGATPFVIFYVPFEFELPSVPLNFSFDNIYLGVHIENLVDGLVSPNVSENKLFIRWKRFVGTPKIISDFDPSVQLDDDKGAGNVVVDCQPDFYYTGVNTKNKNFYWINTLSTPADEIFAHTRFAMGDIDTIDKYNSVDKCIIMMRYALAYNNPQPTPPAVFLRFNIHELSVIFTKSISIKTEIYQPFKGRIFNDTWGSRKTSTDLMESPVDLFENLCRLQDYSDRGIMPSGGWGKAYSDSALIKLAGTGSFDSTELNDIKGLKAARQITVKNQATTESIKQSLCQNFFMVNYRDKDGKECLVPLGKSQDSPSNIVTLSDIRLTGGQITINEPDPTYIYPEPYVRYYQDQGSGKFDGLIQVTNVTANNPSDSEKVSYILGPLNEGESITLYDKCVSLHNISGIIKPPPQSMTDLLWANGTLVNAEDIARWYIFKWVDWMSLKTVSFNVHFTHSSAGVNTREWDPGQKFLLQLPHETNNAQIECLCTKIVIDPKPPYHLRIDAIMLETFDSDFFIQEVMYTAAEGADLDVQETMDLADPNIQEV